MRKMLKAAKLMQRPFSRRALLKHGVAATTEHYEMLRFVNPATLIDVGANKGQFSIATRTLCPRTEIHAFEPLPSAADRFAAVFNDDDLTHLYRFAVAAENSSADFHVADRDDSSSLLPLADGQLAAYGIKTASTIRVETRRLEMFVKLAELTRPTLLKIDVQGAELEVLNGIASFEAIDFVYVELSFVELYLGQPLFENVYAFLEQNGYRLRGLYNASSTEAYGPTQLDALFARWE